VGREFGRGLVKAIYEWRKTFDMVEDFIRLSDGQTTIVRDGASFGTFNNVVFENADHEREYQALILQSNYRVTDRLTGGGSYTLQIRNHGNFTGEGTNTPGAVSIFGDYPEIFDPSLDRVFPEGRLPTFQRHKLRIYGIVTQDLGAFGSVDVAPIWRASSGQVFSFAAAGFPITAIELARNPGYPVNDINPSFARTIFFGERGAGRFKGYGVLDLSATYSIPVWRSARPWLKVDLFNVLGNDKLIAWDTTVTADLASPRDANGIPTGFVQGPRFGQATSDAHFIQPFPGQDGGRAFRMAFGVRF
ncbi:MAG: hypothetical protein HY654_02635, partial [Acidobacteria bacterium]|nr:hypothetical protein [Acidobacteriota bacterium]